MRRMAMRSHRLAGVHRPADAGASGLKTFLFSATLSTPCVMDERRFSLYTTQAQQLHVIEVGTPDTSPLEDESVPAN
jgi:hypothetical protein